jgi:hypothetical protein
MYTLQRVPEKETWVCFMEKIQELQQNVQTLIIEKLHGNTKTWCIQHKSLIIDTSKLTKYRCWLAILVYLLILLQIENVYRTHHVIKLLDCREFNKVNINVLIEKWMPCDALWIPGKKKGEFCLRTKGNEKYSLEKYKQTMLIPTLLIPPLTKRP